MDVRLDHVSQSFGEFKALNDVSFEATKGAIHALVGENGAGKTTLMRVLFGALQPDIGAVSLDGKPVSFRNSAEAIAAGVGMVSQHYSIIPELTCLQNLMLGAEPGWFVSQSASVSRATELASRMGYSFDWTALAETLSPAGRQKLEILKLLWRDSKVMVLDEPTAMLSPADSDALFASLKQLAEKGATIIVVTHRLPEVLDHCATVSVLRGGQNVAQMPVSETSAGQLAEMIVGHEMHAPATRKYEPGPAMLEVSGLTVRGYRGNDAVDGANLIVRQGEVLGIAGVDGNGQRELFQSLVGRVRAKSGSLSFDGTSWSGVSPRERIAQGLRLIPEDRHSEGVIDEWSLEDNAALGLQRLSPFAKGLWTDEGARSNAAKEIAARFNTKHGGLRNPMKSLSGGNQQRFVAARALECGPKVILAFQPTRGLDIDGTAQVYEAVKATCMRGACAIVVSFDLDELLEHCDRVVAITHGKIVEPPPDKAKDRLAIGSLMVGAS